MSGIGRKKKVILFLAANPKNSTPLRLEEEAREIDAALERAQKRDKFQLEQQLAVTPIDMQRAVLEFKPQIVHFSGHGVSESGLILEDKFGKAKLVSAKALADLFELFKHEVECVVLNACYSQVQAEAIAHYIPYVIAMNQTVNAAPSQEFAVGFYDAIGAGRSIEFAYNFGCTSMRMAGIGEEYKPVLVRQSDILAQGGNPSILTTEVESSADSPTAENPPAVVILDNPEGSVSLDSSFYIERPPIEVNCYETIIRPGALIRVKAPRQMGKSSLLQRILHHARQQGHQTAYIDFGLIDAEFLTNLDLFLQWFCGSVSDNLNLEERLADHWKGVLGSKNKCSNYFQRYLLATVSETLTLGLDEVDAVFPHPEIAQDFFGLLRAWHEKGKNEAAWKKLRLVIAHSQEVYIPLNINQSPFNVGVSIELPELNQTQVTELVKRHGLKWSTSQIEQLMGVVDGHPYLLRKALYEITRGGLTLEKFVQVAPTEEGLYGDHLRRHLVNLKENPSLEAAMKQVVASNAPVRLEPSQAFKLRSMGLIELRGNDVIPLCNLYRTYLRDRLGVI